MRSEVFLVDVVMGTVTMTLDVKVRTDFGYRQFAPLSVLLCGEGFCDESSTQSVTHGNNTWPEARVESTKKQPCDFGPANSSVTRECVSRGQWSNPDYSNCYTMITMMYQDFDVVGIHN